MFHRNSLLDLPFSALLTWCHSQSSPLSPSQLLPQLYMVESAVLAQACSSTPGSSSLSPPGCYFRRGSMASPCPAKAQIRGSLLAAPLLLFNIFLLYFTIKTFNFVSASLSALNTVWWKLLANIITHFDDFRKYSTCAMC